MKRLQSGLPVLKAHLSSDPDLMKRWVCAAGNAMLDELQHYLNCTDFKSGTLTIAARTSGWAKEMSIQSAGLQRRINKLGGKQIVNAIDVVINAKAFAAEHKKTKEKEIDISKASPVVSGAAARIRNEKTRAAFIKLGMAIEKQARNRE